ncbi:LlaMI family restriction endonuclease [Clostridioides sp. GD02377]|uniref:LlaMI family restriction endonuclease n=1 Tax=unclassified Clostridioides TaxID=2635829 RepID=UPI0038AF93CC
MTDKNKIIELFNKNVKGRTPNVSTKNKRHDGKYGHWLEEQFGIVANGDNAPDLYGYELKNQTTSKTTFGDWSADYYIYKDSKFTNIFEGRTMVEKRDVFLSIFGQNVNGRYSWSGSPCPKIHGFNDFGQILLIHNNDIVAYYDYNQDKRPNKASIIPEEFQEKGICLAIWNGDSLKKKLEKKFNQNGWFTCKTDSNGVYSEICFGAPMTYENWLELIRQGIVIFDSGMHQKNPRPYSMWRASNSYWDSLIIERY